MDIYPAIDLLDGECVRLCKGEFESKTVYSNDPVATTKWIEGAGAHHLHVVDLSGAKDPKQRQKAWLQKITSASSLKIQCGGGIRSKEDVEDLLAIGVDRVVIGSYAVKEPEKTIAFLKTMDPGRITLALDVRIASEGRSFIATEGWKETSRIELAECIRWYLDVGINRILCTDISRDGMMAGPNLNLYKTLIETFPKLHIQASGGIRSLEDLRDLDEVGVGSAIFGRALYERSFSLNEVFAKC